LRLTLTSLGKFSGRILSAGGSYGLSGLFNIKGQASQSVPRGREESPLGLEMNLDLTGGTQRITGQVTNADWTAVLQADLAAYSAKNPYPNHGKYTLLFGGTNDGSSGPGGDGYATVTINDAGLVSVTGVLSDNTSVAPSPASISQFGQWPLYIPVYGKLGSLVGWIDFPFSTSNSFAGPAAWFRTGPKGKLYPKGFTNFLSIAGSTFTNGNKETPVLQLTTLSVLLDGGGLAGVLSNDVTLYNDTKFITNGPGIPRLKLSVNPSTGVLSGSFEDMVTGRTASIKGVVFQQQTNAAGFFLSTNATGSLLVTPP